MFLEPSALLPTRPAVAATATPLAEPTTAANPTSESALVAASPTSSTGNRYREVPIYKDKLLSTWTLGDSANIKVNPNDRSTVYDGERAIQALPDNGTGKLQFSVRKTVGEGYLRDEVVGISFWVSGGNSIVAPEDLAVTVLGSNKYPYYVANDTSVEPVQPVSEVWPLFSETRLYYLGFNYSIPANTWSEVVLWLDEREFDPLYTYVTGIYIKNDDRRTEPFYIDRVSLLVTK